MPRTLSKIKSGFSSSRIILQVENPQTTISSQTFFCIFLSFVVSLLKYFIKILYSEYENLYLVSEI
ncbi:MAG: hypothetical protein DRZ79_00995 [Candidatus Cloacimonadota bacterium]|nr:MAG: hypothetical protein DRZ79_00995 [Candidatus Cloacimonadota bacterium]